MHRCYVGAAMSYQLKTPDRRSRIKRYHAVQKLDRFCDNAALGLASFYGLKD